jgi:hypothetical protein
MRSHQALLYPHPIESNPAWAQSGVAILGRIHFRRVRAKYRPAAILEQPVLVFSVWREMPNVGRFQGQTCSVSCEDFKNSLSDVRMEVLHTEIRDRNSMRVFLHHAMSVYHILKYHMAN